MPEPRSAAAAGESQSRASRLSRWIFRIAALCAATLCMAASAAAQTTRPNIIFILCDDLGYGDLGVFYQNQRALAASRSEPWHYTPQLDTLAKQGLQLPQHYCPAPVCAPSRGSLLAGVHQGHAGVRDNQFDKALEDNHTLATVLKSAGYRTACIGKWGLQGLTGSDPTMWPAYPTKRGFDDFFGYVAHNDGHEHYPKEGKYQGAKQVWDNNTEVSATLDKCYTTDLFTARAKKWLVDRHTAQPSQPFFLYLAYDTPHATIELPTMAYPAGGGLTGGLQWTGTPGAMINTAGGTIDSYTHPDYANATYDNDKNPATAEVPWPDVDKRYATSVRRIDDCVGDIIQTLKDLGIDQDTLIVFASDNGVSNESYLSQAFDPQFFSSFGPFDGIKRDCWEGGVRVGALVRWPGGVPANRVSNLPSEFQDWMPTFAELAGVPAPARTDGVSLVPTLRNLPGQKTPQVYVEYYEPNTTPNYAKFEPAHRNRRRNQMQVIRFGDMLGVRYNIQAQSDNFEIYNVVSDPKETTNLAASNAQLQQQMKDAVLRLRRPDASAPRPYDNELIPPLTPAATQPGIEWKSFAQAFPWTPELTALTPSASGSAATPGVGVRPRDNDFALLFTGYLQIPADGSYTFYLNSDARAFLRIHDAQVIDEDFGYPAGTDRSGSIQLKAGKHPFRLYYQRGTGGTPALAWQWSGPGITRQAIPASAFVRDGSAPAAAMDDSAKTLQNTAVTIPVLANDSGGTQQQPLQISALGQPRAGSVALSGSQVVYTPAAGFLGEDTFTYTVTDGTQTATATVKVSVGYADNDYWFPFDETSGTTALEAGGYRTATLANLNSTPWVAGRFNRALQFDKPNNMVTIDGFSGILGAGARTCAAWVKTTGTGQMPVIAWGANTNGNKWLFLIQSGQPRLEVTGGWVQASKTVNDGQWHHIACTFSNDGTPDATDVKLYIDGAPAALTSFQSQAINTTASGDVRIGADQQTRYFTGTMDEVRILSRALSAGEVSALAAETNVTAQEWNRRYFGAAPVNWQADDDGDGLTRLAEYAFGTQPWISDPSVLAPEYVNGKLRVTFHRRRAGSSLLSYVVQASTDLTNWQSVSASEVSSTPIDDEFDEVTCEVNTPAGAPKAFFRVIVGL